MIASLIVPRLVLHIEEAIEGKMLGAQGAEGVCRRRRRVSNEGSMDGPPLGATDGSVLGSLLSSMDGSIDRAPERLRLALNPGNGYSLTTIDRGIKESVRSSAGYIQLS